MAVIYLWCG